MARDYAERCPGSPARNTWLAAAAAAILLAAHGIGAQKVRVDEEVEAYPTESVDLRCKFVDGGGKTKLTQVSWIWEPIEGQRDNIAVFHPIYGKSFPNSDFQDRVVFLFETLENPSIRISNLRMADAGRYTCEYATYPSGNEQGTTTLNMLAKPKNSAKALTVQAGSKSQVVALCEAADGKPAATIKWMGSVGGNHTASTTAGPDGTVTVRSEYRMVPTPADNGKSVMCMVDQPTQEQPWVSSVTLSVEYPPTVQIEGYDNNWYVGRSDAVLVCQANANPEPTDVTWTSASGSMPDSVLVEGNKLTVRKVDDAVNTTFVCEVRNKLGVSKQQVTTIVIEEEKSIAEPQTGAIVGSILGALIFIALVIGIVFFIRKRQDGGEGPPKHKPPPPVKAGSSTEMLTKPSGPPMATETAPLSPGDVYYETTGGEPVTNLDDDNIGGGALNGGAPLDDSAKYDKVNELKDHGGDGHHGNDLDPSRHEAPAANIARGESFVSSPMYV
ncbi:PVR cell adhesion molecule related 2 like isoform X2 [Genypterus blacodes]|uniref:PVR cell adhesion molecule related 2 like isoform X2 n=1 Tax=Genypterus blacodes TaxID=154954 RepID=UPI003F76A6B9